jgi:hypothetical protein
MEATTAHEPISRICFTVVLVGGCAGRGRADLSAASVRADAMDGDDEFVEHRGKAVVVLGESG